MGLKSKDSLWTTPEAKGEKKNSSTVAPLKEKEAVGSFKLSSYCTEQKREDKQDACKNFANTSINEIIEGEENYDEGYLERSKASYAESGENKTKLAGPRIAIISNNYPV